LPAATPRKASRQQAEETQADHESAQRAEITSNN